MSGPSGLLVIDKPDGMTSHRVVAAVRRSLGTRKVGHAGTLDPMATGVLIVGVGPATRLLGHLALRDKAYLATIRLGESTDTDDREGEVTFRAPQASVDALDEVAVGAVLATLTGDITQVPSSVSAIKVDGRRAYDLARSGVAVDLKARAVTVSRLAPLAWRRPAPGLLDVDVEVECSTGTYVRALARDAGRALGVGGHLTMLRRTRVGPWHIDEAVALSDVAQAGRLMPIAQAAARAFATHACDAGQVEDLRHGRRIPWPEGADGIGGTDGMVALLGPDGALIALAQRAGDLARTTVVFPADAPTSPGSEPAPH